MPLHDLLVGGVRLVDLELTLIRCEDAEVAHAGAGDCREECVVARSSVGWDDQIKDHLRPCREERVGVEVPLAAFGPSPYAAACYDGVPAVQKLWSLRRAISPYDAIAGYPVKGVESAAVPLRRVGADCAVADHAAAIPKPTSVVLRRVGGDRAIADCPGTV